MTNKEHGSSREQPRQSKEPQRKGLGPRIFTIREDLSKKIETASQEGEAVAEKEHAEMMLKEGIEDEVTSYESMFGDMVVTMESARRMSKNPTEKQTWLRNFFSEKENEYVRKSFIVDPETKMKYPIRMHYRAHKTDEEIITTPITYEQNLYQRETFHPYDPTVRIAFDEVGKITEIALFLRLFEQVSRRDRERFTLPEELIAQVYNLAPGLSTILPPENLSDETMIQLILDPTPQLRISEAPQQRNGELTFEECYFEEPIIESEDYADFDLEKQRTRSNQFVTLLSQTLLLVPNQS